MRALGLTLALPLAVAGLSGCSSDFDPTYMVSCPTPIQVGTAAAINITYTTVDPVAFDWRAEPTTAGTYVDVTTIGDATNEDEPMTVGTQFNPEAEGAAKLVASVNGVDVASCDVDVLPANVPPVTLTLVVVGMGQVTAADPALDCPGTCAADVLPGTTVRLTAAPATDWELTTVTGGCMDVGGVFDVTASEDTTCTFTFVDTSMPQTDQIRIPAGSFTRGCPNPALCPGYEAVATVVLSKDFLIDKYEVTVGQYRRCVDAGGCTVMTDFPKLPPSLPCNYIIPGRDLHPMNCLTWDQARGYCQWLGMDLPTEAQWERAARGATDDRAFPWGDEYPTCDQANITLLPFERCVGATTSSVGLHPAGATPEGCEDMIGNVEELVLDWFSNDYYTMASSRVDPTGPATGSNRLARGGAFGVALPVYDRSRQIPQNAPKNEVGFRCVTNTP